MRLIHLGDLHLGKSLGDFDLIEDQRYILDRILEIVDKNNIDGVLIAGDVYDRAIPSEAATNLLDYFLKSLAERNVKTFMISGNHDSGIMGAACLPLIRSIFRRSSRDPCTSRRSTMNTAK